ncbi:MAG: hypothetical protein AAF202_10215 [Pseudomonadota bacterium]
MLNLEVGIPIELRWVMKRALHLLLTYSQGFSRPCAAICLIVAIVFWQASAFASMRPEIATELKRVVGSMNVGQSTKAADNCPELLSPKTESIGRLAHNEDVIFSYKGVTLKFENWSNSEIEIVALAEAALGMSLVWTHHRPESTFATITILNEFRVGAGLANYSLVFDQFAISAAELKNASRHLPLNVALLLAMSHEMMHRVQKHRGDQLEENSSLTETDLNAYSEQPAEIEANMEMMEIAKCVYPSFSRVFRVGTQTFRVPEVSRYCGDT